MIQKVLSSTDVVKLLNDIFTSLSVSEKFSEKRQKIAKNIFIILKQSKLSSKHVENIVNRIIVDFPMYKKVNLVKFVDFFINSIRDNSDEYMRYDIIFLLNFRGLSNC